MNSQIGSTSLSEATLSRAVSHHPEGPGAGQNKQTK